MSELGQTGELERIWNPHRGFLRRLLIGMTRDIDLAEDLLQDTYVRARTGFSGYHGGDPRAWLSAIARSAFLTHVRRMSYSRERYELTDEQPDRGIAPGSVDHLDALSIRQAVAGLEPRLRTALILKHYAGLKYEEIAAETECAVGTAKWRVNQAVGQLRSALGIAPRIRPRRTVSARASESSTTCTPVSCRTNQRRWTRTSASVRSAGPWAVRCAP